MRILVTGATGNVGVEVAAGLARQGHAVVAAVHRRQTFVRNNGRPLAVTTGDAAGASAGQVVSHALDVGHPTFGLTTMQYARLQNAVDLVVHCAAAVELGLPAEVYELANTVGTQHVVRFATEGRETPLPLLHVSTAFVSGDHPGRFRESDFDCGQAAKNPYEKSKFAAERIVRAAMARGLPAVIARPSAIVGASTTGQIRDYHVLYPVLRLAVEGKVRSMAARFDATINIVPIDYVAQSLVRIAAEVEAHAGATYHLVGAEGLTPRDFSDVLAEFPSAHVPRFIPPTSFSLASLEPLERAYYERLVVIYEPYLRTSVEFTDDEFRRTFAPKRPVSGRTLLRRAVDYCFRARYFRPLERAAGGDGVDPRVA